MAVIFLVADPDPDKLREALIAALRKEPPSKAVCDEIARMLDPAGKSEFKLVVQRRKRGKPGQHDDAWFAKYRRAEKIFSGSPSKRAGLARVRKALFTSDVTAREYYRTWEEQQKLFWENES